LLFIVLLHTFTKQTISLAASLKIIRKNARSGKDLATIGNVGQLTL
jgi:hypothetical protein